MWKGSFPEEELCFDSIYYLLHIIYGFVRQPGFLVNASREIIFWYKNIMNFNFCRLCSLHSRNIFSWKGDEGMLILRKSSWMQSCDEICYSGHRSWCQWHYLSFRNNIVMTSISVRDTNLRTETIYLWPLLVPVTLILGKSCSNSRSLYNLTKITKL